MTPEITAGPVRQELAAAIRAINARHAEIGSPDLVGLRHEWVRLDRALGLAVIAGDDEACRIAVRSYRRNSLALIEEAAR